MLKTIEKGSGQREARPIWNHAMRVNHQNFSNSKKNFAPTSGLTKSGIVLISTTRRSSSRVAAPVSTARPINTATPKPIVNVGKSRRNAFQKTHSLSRRPFHQQTTLKNIYLVNTAKVKSVNTAKGKSVTSAIGKQWSNAVKSSACWVWSLKLRFKIMSPKTVDHTFVRDLTMLIQKADSNYQEYDGGFVAFTGVLKELHDENQVLLKVPRKNNMYSFDLKNVVPSKGKPCKRSSFKDFENNHTCVAYQKGKQHKASSKKDETCGILKDFITGIENQLNHKVKIIRCDNRTEFKNYEMNQFCGIKWIKREFSNARTPKQNGVAEKKNKTLIEAARTMLADLLLPIPFWTAAVNTACYVQDRVLVTKPHNKTPYELLIGIAPIISFMRPFGYPVTILNTLDHLRKFDGKADEGFLVGYSINSKAFRVYNCRTKKVEENLHVNFLENKPNVAGSGQEGKEKVTDQEYILLPVLNTSSYVPSSNEEVKSSPKDDASKKSIVELTCVEEDKIYELGCLDQQMKSTDDFKNTNSTNKFNTASDKDATFQRTYGEWNFSTPVLVNVVSSSFSHPAALDDFSKLPNLEDTRIFDDAYDNRDEGVEADYNNLEIMEPKKVTQSLDDESWDSPLELIAYSDSDYVGASLDRKYITGGCQFLGSRLISWQCKKQSIMANSTTEAEYTKIHRDNESAICVVKNLVYHLKTKHIKIRHHFTRDSYKKRLIEMVKTHTNSNVTDLLTKAFDVTRFQFLLQALVYLILRTWIKGRLEALRKGNLWIFVSNYSGLYILDTWNGVKKWSSDENGLILLTDKIEFNGYLHNECYADLVQHASDRVNTAGQTATGKEFLNPLMAEPFSSLHISMANLKFVDQHNMVAYLEKSEDNREFHHIVDFLSSCSITYAFTGIDIGGRPRRQETMGGTFAQTSKQEVQETAENSRDDDDETLAETLLNIKRNLAKDKGKRIIHEKERYNLEKALELQRQLDQRKENVPKRDQAKEIDWNDPQVLRCHALQNRPFSKAEVRKNMIMYLKNQEGYKQSYFKGMKYEDIKPLFERIWDQVYTFVPKDSEIEREVMKRVRFDLQQGSLKKQRLVQQTEETEEEASAQATQANDEATKDEMKSLEESSQSVEDQI
nr:hypothetical protein [Tanacetum cinerariifolium]